MKPQAQINIFDEIIVDNFAGGGGASTGIELATGRPVTAAVNHDPDAILMHQTNHPYTKHYCESVWDIDPREVCAGRTMISMADDGEHGGTGGPYRHIAGGNGMKRKIEAMHEAYGTDPAHVCRECCNFVRVRPTCRILRKCEAYGVTRSEASDWAGKWTACGRFGQPFGEWECPLIEVLKCGRGRRGWDDPPIAGQMTFGGEDTA